MLTLEAFPAPSEALLDTTKVLLATSDSETLSPGTLEGPLDLSGGSPKSLEALQVPRRPYPFLFPFHDMALSAPSRYLLTPFEVPQQPPMPSQLPPRLF